MIYTYAVPREIAFSDCDMQGTVRLNHILSWLEDQRFSMTEVVGLQNFLPENHRVSTEEEQIENPLGEEFLMPVLKLRYCEKRKIRFGESVLVHTHLKKPTSGQLVFLQFVTDDSGNEIYFVAEYIIGIVGKKIGLTYNIPEIIRDQINIYLDILCEQKKGFPIEIEGEYENFIH